MIDDSVQIYCRPQSHPKWWFSKGIQAQMPFIQVQEV